MGLGFMVCIDIAHSQMARAPERKECAVIANEGDHQSISSFFVFSSPAIWD